MRKGVAIFSIMFLSIAAVAELEWERTTQRVDVRPMQVKAEYTFPFKNTGTSPVDFISIRPSCSCIGARPGKKRYEPGESGVVKATFDLSGRVGLENKSIAVITSDHPKKKKQLIVETHIPQSYIIKPMRLTWELDEVRDSKYVMLTNVSEEKTFIANVRSSDLRIKAELVEVQEGFEYKIKLTPETDAHRVRSVIRIATVPPEGLSKSKNFKMYVHVK